MGDCPNISEGDEELLYSHHRRILEKCSECENFRRDLARFSESGHSLAPVFYLIHSEYRRQKNQIQSLVSFLDSKTLEVRFLHELGSVLQSSVDLEEVLSVALTAITAGKGFGMNRAFLLLSNRESGNLEGYLAIGPRSYEEASRIWDEISNNDMDLQSLAQAFRKNKLSTERDKFHDILEKLATPLSDADNILVKVLESKQPLLVEDAFNNPDIDHSFTSLMGVDSLLLMPLISRNRKVGIIIADNCITHRRITEQDLHSIENFSFLVAFAIERASLYERLQIELDRVKEANARLKEQQELMVRMEKMALVGRITSNIAHSIRNPLMVIGGFAKSILKKTSPDDPNWNFIESIVNEALQLENVLGELINYSEELYPSRDSWDINRLLEKEISNLSDKLSASECRIDFTPATRSFPLVCIDYRLFAGCLRNIILNEIDGIRGLLLEVVTEYDELSVSILIRNRKTRYTEEDIALMFTPSISQEPNLAWMGFGACRALLEKQGIKLAVSSMPDSGIEYRINLPIGKGELL